MSDRGFGRRGVVATGGVLLGAAALQATPGGRALLSALLDPDGPAARAFRADGTVRVERIRREADQLVLDLVLVDMATVVELRQTYVTPSGSAPGYLAVVLPPQSMGEAVHHNPATAAGAATTKSEVALPSVLAFSVPVGTKIPFDLPSLLDWSGLTPRWTNPDDPVRPGSAVEAPYRLHLRPDPSLVWVHDTEPKTLGTTTELWHTRLTARNASGVVDPRAPKRPVSVPRSLVSNLGTPLDTTDRKLVVTQAASLTTSATKGPANADLLLLSSLGASLEIHGVWPEADNLVAWDHRATYGRDQYVRTVLRGYLAPWGHPAVFVRESWRRMRTFGSVPMAVLEVVETIVVTDPVVDTKLADVRKKAGGHEGSRLPFTTVRCTTRQSPPLRVGEDFKVQGGVPIVQGTGENLRFTYVGTDWAGAESVFSSEVFFVAGKMPSQSRSEAWNKADVVRTVQLGGQRMALVPEDPAHPGGATVPVQKATVEVVYFGPAKLKGVTRAPFRPVLTSLDAEIPSLSALVGSATIPHTYAPSHVTLQENKGGVVLQAKTPQAAPIAGERTGGIAGLPGKYQGLSSTTGAVLASSKAALEQAAKQTTSAEDIFGSVTLLAGIPLAKIVQSTPDALPAAVTETVAGRQTVTLRMAPELKAKYKAGPIVLVPGSLTLVTVVAAGGDAPAEQSLDAELLDSTLQLAGIVKLPIDRLRVTSGTGAPFDLQLDLGDLEFLGPLAFVQTLAEVLAPLLQERHPTARRARLGLPDVDVDTAGIHVSQTLAVPDVAVGVFTLSGLAFGLDLDLLFDGTFTTRFAFASHENPFQAAYGPFGGGGYVALTLTGGDVTNVEVSLMVCGGIGINLGVAAGAISVSAGFVLALPPTGVVVTCFFRASGALEVLGLVSISVVFEISLDILPSTDPVTLVGTASLALKVDVMLVSKTVHAEVSKTITGGSQGSPAGLLGRRAGEDKPFSFRDCYPTAAPWEAYADAFAPAGD